LNPDPIARTFAGSMGAHGLSCSLDIVQSTQVDFVWLLRRIHSLCPGPRPSLRPSSHLLLDDARREDIVFIGGGPSMVFTLAHLLEDLSGIGAAESPVRVTVIHPNDEFGTGTPYPAATGTWPLLITSARHLLPGGAENPFVCWLQSIGTGWMDELRATGSPRERAWLAEHREMIERGEIADVYLPRHLFGRYLSHRLATAIDAAGPAARVRFVAARATGIARRGERRFIVRTDDEAHPAIECGMVLLATGSPPPSDAWAALDGAGYVHDVYRTGAREIERRLMDALDRAPADARVVIAGSNAAAMEMLYMMRTEPALLDRIHRVTVVSIAGRLPDPRDVRTGIAPACERLRAVAADPAAPRADAMLRAFLADVRDARAGGATAEDLSGTVPRRVLELLGRMDAEERVRFLAGAAGTLQQMLRRSGGPYVRAAAALRERGTLEVVAGTVSLDGGGFAIAANGGAPARMDDAALVINCTGSTSLDHDPTPLMRSLRAAGDTIAPINPTRRGFAVDARFESTPNVFVMGPLLAGYSHGATHVWRLESADRISLLAPQLAAAMRERLLEARAAAA
jgi:uncharacterized NAD(P)/FAD-binding protein YdhS